MRILVTGGKGQLGMALGPALHGHAVTIADLPEVDITASGAIAELARVRPEIVIHAAAMTNVDEAARNPELAFRINALGTRNVALAARQCGADLVYVSSNEVFDGTASDPYREYDATNPINAYGASKLAGETIVRQLLPNSYVVRTAWVFGGASSFVTKMLELGRARGELTVVDDEIANPTFAPDLASGISQLMGTGLYGTYHLTNTGVTSRYDYAAEIFRVAGVDVKLGRIGLRDYQRASRPPGYSPLHNQFAAAANVVLRSWQEAVAEHVGRLVPA